MRIKPRRITGGIDVGTSRPVSRPTSFKAAGKSVTKGVKNRLGLRKKGKSARESLRSTISAPQGDVTIMRNDFSKPSGSKFGNVVQSKRVNKQYQTVDQGNYKDLSADEIQRRAEIANRQGRMSQIFDEDGIGISRSRPSVVASGSIAEPRFAGQLSRSVSARSGRNVDIPRPRGNAVEPDNPFVPATVTNMRRQAGRNVPDLDIDTSDATLRRPGVRSAPTNVSSAYATPSARRSAGAALNTGQQLRPRRPPPPLPPRRQGPQTEMYRDTELRAVRTGQTPRVSPIDLDEMDISELGSGRVSRRPSGTPARINEDEFVDVPLDDISTRALSGNVRARRSAAERRIAENAQIRQQNLAPYENRRPWVGRNQRAVEDRISARQVANNELTMRPRDRVDLAVAKMRDRTRSAYESMFRRPASTAAVEGSARPGARPLEGLYNVSAASRPSRTSRFLRAPSANTRNMALAALSGGLGLGAGILATGALGRDEEDDDAQQPEVNPPPADETPEEPIITPEEPVEQPAPTPEEPTPPEPTPEEPQQPSTGNINYRITKNRGTFMRYLESLGYVRGTREFNFHMRRWARKN
jgi:hypothetical protein